MCTRAGAPVPGFMEMIAKKFVVVPGWKDRVEETSKVMDDWFA